MKLSRCLVLCVVLFMVVGLVSMTSVEAATDIAYNETQDTYHETIGEAIENAEPEDVIVIVPGSYAGDIEIAVEGLTLKGPNAGLAGYDEREDEARITGQIIVDAANVVIDGFNIDMGETYIDIKDHAGIEIRNNIISDTGGSKMALMVRGADELIIEQNWFHDTNSNALTFYGEVNDLLFKDNLFTDIGNSVFHSNADKLQGFTIEGNVIENTGSHGINLNFAEGVIDGLIRDNRIEDVGALGGTDRAGIQFRDVPFQDITVENNTFENCQIGIQFRELVESLNNVTVTYNSFLDNEVSVKNLSGFAVNAPRNWWGYADPDEFEVEGNLYDIPWALDPDFTAFGSFQDGIDPSEDIPLVNSNVFGIEVEGLEDDLVFVHEQFTLLIPATAFSTGVNEIGLLISDALYVGYFFQDELSDFAGEPAAAPEGLNFQSNVFRFIAIGDPGSSEEQHITDFEDNYTMTFFFNPDDVDDADALAIYWYDADAEEWVEIESTVDADAGTVTAEIDHFSDFVLMEAEAEEEEEEPALPETGTGIMWLIPLGLAMILASLLVLRKRVTA